MNYTGRLWLIAALIFACFVTRPCRADIDRYSNPAGFKAAIADATTIDFEGLIGAGATKDYDNPGSVTLNGVTFASNGSLVLKNTNAHGTGAYLTAQADSTDVTITLPAGTTAIGFNIGSESPNLSINVELSTGQKFPVYGIDYPDLKFYGLTSTTPITSLHLTSSTISLDNITIGHRDVAQRHYIVDAVYQGFYDGVFFKALNNYGDMCGYTVYRSLFFTYVDAIIFLRNGNAYFPLGIFNSQTEADGINDAGVAIINNLSGTSYTDPYFWTGAQGLTRIGNYNIHVYGINNSGQVVLTPPIFINNNLAYSHASILQNNTLFDLGAPYIGTQYNNSYGFALNNKGQATGYTFAQNGDAHACLGTIGLPMQDLGTPFRDVNGFVVGTSIGHALNDQGHIVGEAYHFTDPGYIDHAFLYKNGTMQDIGVFLGKSASNAMGINSADQVVGNITHYGNTTSNNDYTTGFLWQNGILADINDLLPVRFDGVAGFTSAINERGQIASDRCLLTPEALDVSSVVRVGSSGLIYNRQTRTYNATITLTNTGQDPILGPLQVELVGLTPGAALVNQTGTHNGNPYYYHNAVIKLLPGQSTSVPVQISYTGSSRLSYSVRAYTGAFQQ